MISERTKEGIKKSSAVRAMFTEGREMAAKFGAENIFDFSLGNPATPAPDKIREAIIRIAGEEEPMALHGYMDNAGYEDVRRAIADNLNRRFETAFSERNIVMTVGAAGAINVVLRTIINPGDEVICLAPYFSEYNNYIANWDAKVVVVKPELSTFAPDFDDLRDKVSKKTKAIIINNPVNPSGVVYSEETIKKIARILKDAGEKYGTRICMISDEPYRELVYDGEKVPFLTKYYDYTFVTYSFSKSLSLPGERIGYIAIPDTMPDFDEVVVGLSLANRVCGFVNAPSLIQKVIRDCVDCETDLEFYDKNRRLLYKNLTSLGFTCVEPKGAFYLFLKSPEPDDKAFVEHAKKYNIIMVNGTSFACPGYVRLAYCLSTDSIERSYEAFKKLAADYGLQGEKNV